MQRLHEEDLAGHVLKGKGYEYLCLPSEFEKSRAAKTSIGWTDPRTEDRELLFPEMFPREVLAEARVTLGSSGFAGQHQQRPAPATGAIFQRSWWRYYREPLAEFEEMIQSWDLSFKGTDGTDYVVGQVWGSKGASLYLLDQVRDRMSFTTTCAAVRQLSAKWPAATLKLIEDTANGPAVRDTLSREVGGIVPVKPDGSKEARAHAVSPLIEAGNVWLPESAPWVQDLVEECCSFPKGAHDDQVDAMTQALRRLGQRRDEPVFASGRSARGWR